MRTTVIGTLSTLLLTIASGSVIAQSGAGSPAAPSVGTGASGALASPVVGSMATLTGPDEPGAPLHIEGRVVDAVSGDPVAGAHLVLYHADDAGTYQPSDPADESTARLRAELRTDVDGRFGFRTILPGEYPDQPPGNRHIHVHSVTADGHAQLGFVILFEDNVRDDVRSWARSTGFGQVIDLEETDGLLVGVIDVRLEPAPAPSAGAGSPSAAPPSPAGTPGA